MTARRCVRECFPTCQLSHWIFQESHDFPTVWLPIYIWRKSQEQEKFFVLFCLDHFDLAIVTRSNHRISRYRKIFQIYKCIYVSMYVKKSPMWPIYPKCPRLTKLCVITNGYELSRVIMNCHELSWIVLNYHVLSWIVINHH